jgi:hypothetical protein
MKDPLTESDYKTLAAERGLTLATLCDLVFGGDAPSATDEELISEVRVLVEYYSSWRDLKVYNSLSP